MISIVNVNENWGIGCDGDLLVNIPEDMKFFRTATSGKTVIMGRKTLESFPGMKPLKGRINIVMTGDPGRIKPESKDGADEVFIFDELDEASGELAVKHIIKAAFENEELTKNNAKASEKHTFLVIIKTKEEVLSLARLISEAFKADEKAGCGSDEEAKHLHKQYSDEIFIIGGASIYSLFLPECDKCLVTVNDSKLEADTYYPCLDKAADWKLQEEGELQTSESGLHYSFRTYIRIKN